jgi:aquaporin Z
MEAAEAAGYLFSVCAFATLLWHPNSPLQRYVTGQAARRMLMGSAVCATIIAIVITPWGKQSGAHFNPAVTLTFYRLRKMAWQDAAFYCASQLIGAVAGVTMAALVLQRAPAHSAVHYAATVPGKYREPVAFIAELAVSFTLMSAILFASNHRLLADYTHYFAAVIIGLFIAFESPLSGMSANPARTLGPALYAGYWRTLWLYFIAPPLGMLGAAEIFLFLRHGAAPYCAKLHHHNNERCIFCHSGADPKGETRTPARSRIGSEKQTSTTEFPGIS